MGNEMLLALLMVPAIVCSGVGLTGCRMWAKSHPDEPAMGLVWQLAVTFAVTRAVAVVVEAVACIRLLSGT